MRGAEKPGAQAHLRGMKAEAVPKFGDPRVDLEAGYYGDEIPKG